MNLFLQIFLYVDVFIIGAVFAVAISHAYAHFKTTHQKPTPKEKKEVPLTKSVRDRLITDAEAKYASVIDRASEQFSKEMSITTDKINASITKLASDIMKKEHDQFDQLLSEYKSRAVNTMENTKNQTVTYENELKAKLEQEVEQEKQRLIQLVDSKLADALLSFLTESMPHEVDLGAQTDYLIKQLEQHKQEFKQAIES